MRNNVICNVCGYKMSYYDTVDHCVIGHSDIQNQPFHRKETNIVLMKCNNCFHVQSVISACKYDDYLLRNASDGVYYGMDSDLWGNKLSKLESFVDDRKLLFEIGCGKGNLLLIASDYFDECIGIDPSKSDCDIATQRGLNVINNYFDESFKINKKISAFVSTMVFEHLDKPLNILMHMYEILEAGGAGIINVPNGEKIIRNKLYDQILTEHVNYYSVSSLCILAKRAGFDICSVDINDNLYEIDIYVKKPTNNIRFNDKQEENRRQLQIYLNGKKNITIWGAGSKANSYSNLLSPNINVKHIIDSSINRVGMYVSGINLPIELVSSEIIKNSDSIVIFATTFKDEIITTLKDVYMYNGDIIFFENDNSVKHVKV